jgi:hypothetical protein
MPSESHCGACEPQPELHYLPAASGAQAQDETVVSLTA